MLLNSIKSNHILGKIIKEYIKKNIYLNIICHNKYLQSRLKISNKTYEECSQIIFELIPINQLFKEKNYIVNPRGNETLFHIYINESNNEFNRFYITPEDKVNKIKVLIDYKIFSIYELFKDCDCLKEIKLTQFYRKGFNDLSKMFNGCSKLEKLDITLLKTTHVTNMSSMFNGCSSLSKINLKNFDTKNVTKMNFMFNGCTKLQEIYGLENFRTEKVINMEYMFWGSRK